MQIPRTAALLVACLAALAGCFYSRRSDWGPDRVDAERAARIHPGTTSRAELLEDLGPPDAVVRPGTPSAQQATDAAALELFNARGQSVDGRCVYLYGASARVDNEGLVLLAVSKSATTTTRRLWVLVDDKSGIVADCVYRED